MEITFLNADFTFFSFWIPALALQILVRKLQKFFTARALCYFGLISRFPNREYRADFVCLFTPPRLSSFLREFQGWSLRRLVHTLAQVRLITEADRYVIVRYSLRRRLQISTNKIISFPGRSTLVNLCRSKGKNC